MRMSRLIHLLSLGSAVLILVLLVVSPVTAAEEPSFIPPLNPPNDTFVNAADLVLNQRAKTIGLLGFAGLESLETSDPDLTSCPMYHTVWYTFMAPFSGYLALSTAGSTVYSLPDRLDVSTRMAIYTGTTLANLTQQACALEDASGIANIGSVGIVGGNKYYVRVGTGYNDVFNGTLKVRAVILDARDWDPVGLVNESFESAISPADWTVKKAYNGDGRDCTTAAVGTCSFKFVGGVDEATKIQQSRTWSIWIVVGHEAHRLEVYSYYKASTAPNLKMQLCISYSDGTPTTKASVVYSTVQANYRVGQSRRNLRQPECRRDQGHVQEQGNQRLDLLGLRHARLRRWPAAERAGRRAASPARGPLKEVLLEADNNAIGRPASAWPTMLHRAPTVHTETPPDSNPAKMSTRLKTRI
ncbi:MAG: hypothetical protein IPM16_23450 [Chloroflexi bacterium]|nr:hypothetical protein [Chloroflexota bacterium]